MDRRRFLVLIQVLSEHVQSEDAVLSGLSKPAVSRFAWMSLLPDFFRAIGRIHAFCPCLFNPGPLPKASSETIIASKGFLKRS